MKISVESASNRRVVKIEGLVRGTEEVSRIKSEFSNFSENEVVELHFIDSYIIPSSLIGFLLKVIHEDRIKLKVIIEKQELYELLRRLNLTQSLNVAQK